MTKMPQDTLRTASKKFAKPRSTQREPGESWRSVGVSLEHRQDLLGHERARMTRHYSSAEIRNWLAAVKRIAKSREPPAGTVLRIVG